MTRLVSWLDAKMYPGFQANWDDRIFRERILSRIARSSRILDFGAGRGNVEAMNFRGKVLHVAGVDVEPAVLANPYRDDAAVLTPPEYRIPFPESSFDVVFADNVLEHLENPELVLGEIGRVLKPGGAFLGKTPGKWHYMPIIARATPTSFHRFFNRLRGRKEVDTFPTLYRCNTRRAVLRCARTAGLSVGSMEFIEGRPEYLRLTWVTYVLGYIYERIVNSQEILAPLRSVKIIHLCKPVSGKYQSE